MVTKQFKDSIVTDDLTRFEVNKYVYGHHKDRASFLASMREGCAMCNRFRHPTGNDNPKSQNLGYFSVFHVALDQERTVDEPIMFVEVGNSSGGFEFVPFGKTFLTIILRQPGISTYLQTVQGVAETNGVLNLIRPGRRQHELRLRTVQL